MELNHLHHFYEVAQSRSFAEASRRLNISQSTLSKAVQLLEDSVSVQLFLRSKSGVTLTPIGQEVFKKCEILFQTFSDIENVCRGKSETCKGALKIGASDHVSRYLLVRLLIEMKEKFPEIEPGLYSSAPNEIIAAILNQNIEFGLFFTQVHLPQIRYEEIGSLPMVLVCHPDLATGLRRGFAINDLRKAVKRFGLITSIRDQYRHQPSEGIFSLLSSPRISFESNSQEIQKRVCLEKGGFVLLARFMVEEELANGQLRAIELKKPIELKLHLAVQAGRMLSHNANVLIQFLRARI